MQVPHLWYLLRSDFRFHKIIKKLKLVCVNKNFLKFQDCVKNNSYFGPETKKCDNSRFHLSKAFGRISGFRRISPSEFLANRSEQHCKILCTNFWFPEVIVKLSSVFRIMRFQTASPISFLVPISTSKKHKCQKLSRHWHWLYRNSFEISSLMKFRIINWVSYSNFYEERLTVILETGPH